MILTWDFGDGTLIQGSNRVKHIYNQGGDYLVKITADDQSASPLSRNMAQTEVHINNSPVAVIKAKDLFCVAEPVTLSGADSFDPDKNDLKYNWDFGDGYTGVGVVTTHNYKNPGEYLVKLMVDDGSGCGNTSTQKKIKVMPSASLNMIQNRIKICVAANADYQVVFDFDKLADTNLGDFNCFWDFGDGVQAQGRSVAHTYRQGGKHEVTIKVDDGRGLSCSVATGKFIVWLNKPPIVFIAPREGCCVNEEYNFDASASSDPENDDLTFVWDFGDQVTSSGAQVKHAYKKGGDYIVKLTVDDHSGFGCSAADNYLNVHVNDGPVADFKVTSR